MKDLIAGLVESGSLPEKDASAVSDFLARQKDEVGVPVFAKVLSGIGAWAACSFLLGLLALFLHDIFDSPIGRSIFGIVFIAVAIIADISLRQGSQVSQIEKVFKNQASLILIVAGKLLLISCLTEGEYEINPFLLSLFVFILSVATYKFYPHNIERFFSFSASFLMLVFTAMDGSPMLLVVYLLIAGQLAGIYIIFLRDTPPRNGSKAIGYACSVSLIVSLLFFTVIFFEKHEISDYFGRLPVSFGIGFFSIFAIRHFLLEKGADWRTPHKILGALFIFTGFLSAPGISAALAFLIIGYKLRDNIILAMGFLFTPVFITIFYYDISISLAWKSLILILSGMALIGASMFFKRLAWENE